MILGLALFFVWGWYWDWGVFTALWGLQLSRYDIGFNTVITLFTQPYITDRLFFDGWIYFGFIAMGILLLKLKKHLFIITPFLTYFLVYVWAIPGEQAQGWYRYPLYPFLIIAVALILIRLYLYYRLDFG